MRKAGLPPAGNRLYPQLLGAVDEEGRGVAENSVQLEEHLSQAVSQRSAQGAPRAGLMDRCQPPRQSGQQSPGGMGKAVPLAPPKQLETELVRRAQNPPRAR